MFKILFLALQIGLIGCATQSFATTAGSANPAALKARGLAVTQNAVGQVKHFVAFRYKPAVTEEEKQEVRERFLALKSLSRLPNGQNYILSIEAGVANSPEGADQGFEEGFIVTFKSEDDRNYYVGKPFFESFDPAHDAFKAFVGPLLSVNSRGQIDGAYVFDFTIP